MRRLYLYLSIILSAMLVLAACDKNSPTESQESTERSMTIKVNGKDWSANSAVIGTYSNNLLTITGQRNPGGSISEQIQIVIYNISGTGSFQLSFLPNTGRYTYADSPSNIITYLTMDNNAGIVNITSLDAKGAKGTFNFTAKNTLDQSDLKNLTEGTFEVTF